MEKKNAEEILAYMLASLVDNLEELSSQKVDGNDFMYGEKTAYVECLEVIQFWNKAEDYGLNFEIEKRYPL